MIKKEKEWSQRV
uniref:Uncharacterized protein n=1 Tax=Anguilla anguilla TaxID=7936 RepID=A0A0E9TXJ1_ANGAN